MPGIELVTRFIGTPWIELQSVKLRMKQTYPVTSNHVYAVDCERFDNAFSINLAIWYQRSARFLC